MIAVIQIIFLLFNIIVAKWQAYRFDVQQKKINHTLWSIIYLALVIIAFVFSHSMLLAIACLLQRIPVFNTTLNFCRTPRRAIFYINPKGESWQDRLYAKFYPAVFWICIAATLTLQYFIFR